jgi:uncharacterized protein (TIGR03086 family)
MTYTKSVLLPVTPDEAFALITEPERLRRWQTVSARVDLRAGGEYRWTVAPGHVAAGTYREVEPGKRVVLGWGWEGDSDVAPDSSVVTVTVEPATGGSRVTLTHEGLTEHQAEQHAQGWNHYLARLEALATTGDAGADEWTIAPGSLDLISSADATLAALQRVLSTFTTADQTRRTPCAEFDCHDLAEHLVESLTSLGAMAGIEVTQPETGSLENRVAIMGAQVIDAWRARGTDGTIPGPGGEIPATVGAAVLSLEFLLHGWDFAEATGQQLEVSDVIVTYVQGLADEVIPGSRARGAFAQPVPPSDGSDALGRLVAFAGRTPIAA